MATTRAGSFLEIDWADRGRAKDTHWANVKAERGLEDAVRAADALRRQVLAVRPDWPSRAERERDLKTHLRVWEIVGRVGRLGS